MNCIIISVVPPSVSFVINILQWKKKVYLW